MLTNHYFWGFHYIDYYSYICPPENENKGEQDDEIQHYHTVTEPVVFQRYRTEQ